MNAVRQIMLTVLGITLAGFFSANVAKDVSPGSGSRELENAFWLTTQVPDELLAGRLNVTNVAKTSRMPLPTRSPRRHERTAQLMR